MLDKLELKHLLIALIVLTVVAVGGIIITVKIITSDGMPSLSELENPEQKIATQIFSSDGEILDHFFIERRVPLTYSEIPKDFVNALVATEDKQFWNHWGVHSKRVVGSLIKNILAGYSKEGASTITMQLAGNLYLDRREATMKRKIREAATAFQIEKTYTKEEIIELYANTVNFGRGSYGLQVAANKYFDKEPLKLTTAECAFLVGLLKKPEYFNKRANYNEAIKRRNFVLSMMLEDNYISQNQYHKSINEGISFMQTNIPKNQEQNYRRLANLGIAPHFVEMIRQNVLKDKRLSEYDFYRDGLTIYTTLNADIQRALNKAVNEYMPSLQDMFDKSYSWGKNSATLNKLLDKAVKEHPNYKEAERSRKQQVYASLSTSKSFIDSVKNTATTIQVGVVIIDPTNGAILGMVGASPKFMLENPDAKYSLNHAVQIKRQPGSAFKPFVYASALSKGKLPSSTIASGPFSYTLPSGEVWAPRGSAKDSIGSVTYTRGLVGSINSVSARLITEVTSPEEVVQLVKKAGIDSKLDPVPALSLGAGGDVSPLEITGAFEIFVNNGVFVQPYYYDRIENRQGEVVSARKMSNAVTEVLEKEVAAQMTYMLQQVVQYGTATRVKNYLKDVEAAGKTGTTNEAADAWFIGYTPQLLCGIWMGFDDKRINFNCLGATGYGGRAVAPLWGAIMAEIYKIPNFPYRQKKFIIADAADTTTNDIEMLNIQKLPYPMTKRQQETEMPFSPPTENNKADTGTFLQNEAIIPTERMQLLY
ncbi:MAG: penicillin-binding protein [Ignavibacteria bacterium]|nr:penicillin-binding protein [Ignavibacteria bacterium]